MKTIYHYKAKADGFIISNHRSLCEECINECNAKNELYKCPVFKEIRRRGQVDIEGGQLYICTNEAIKSARIFLEKLRVHSSVISEIDAGRKDVTRSVGLSVNRLVHNLISINAQSLQSIYALIPQEEFSQRNRDQLLQVITSKVTQDPLGIAILIVDLLKNETLKKSEISVYAKLFQNEPVHKLPYNIHKVVMLVLNTFWDAFSEGRVKFDVGSCYEKVFVDYEAVAGALVHILENASKYILPDSTLKIAFRVDGGSVLIIFEMLSMKVEHFEEDKIFEEGYSGVNPSNLGKAGKGLGLYLVSKLLEITGGSISFQRDCDPKSRIEYRGWDFEKNIFTIALPIYIK